MSTRPSTSSLRFSNSSRPFTTSSLSPIGMLRPIRCFLRSTSNRTRRSGSCYCGKGIVLGALLNGSSRRSHHPPASQEEWSEWSEWSKWSKWSRFDHKDRYDHVDHDLLCAAWL